MHKKKPTVKISDIASAAGVSTATVSRVLNEAGSVNEEIRSRVLKVIDELGYKPHRVHKKAENKSWVVVLVESPINAFFSQILAAIQEQAAEHGLYVFVVQMPENSERCSDILSLIKQQNWTGIISAGFFMAPEAWIQFREETGTPLVLMNMTADHPGIASLKVDFKTASANAIQHLLDMGHIRIAYIGDYGNDISYSEFVGVEMALKQRGFDYPEEYKISVAHSPEGASQSVSRMMMLPEEIRPTAVLTYDDEFAIHMLNALRYYDLRVPEDISVIGFDNIPMSARTLPALTTVDIPKYRVGRQLLELLLQLTDNVKQGPVGDVIVDGSLIVRGSTGPAKV